MPGLPIKLGWKEGGTPIRLDLLPPLSGKTALHVHKSEGLNKGHVKLEYDDTPYCLSLFIFDLKAFMNNRRVRVRSYDLWPKEIMFQARTITGELHPKSGGRIYREDAIIVDWGEYVLENGLIEFKWHVSNKILTYKIIFVGIRRYMSPKYGYSVRTEYIFEPVVKKPLKI